MKTLFSTLFNVMLRSVTIDKIEEFHCYSFDEGEIYVALTQPHSPILKTFPPQEDFFWLMADFSGSSSVTVCFTIDVPCKYYKHGVYYKHLTDGHNSLFL